MTVTLHLKPELEAGLLAKAQARGMDVEHYVQALVEREVWPSQRKAPSEQPSRQEAVRRMLEFGDKHHLDLGEPITRESLHDGHRF
jgi:hypothetical protein